MASVITINDMINQVEETLGSEGTHDDAVAIADAVHDLCGIVDIDTLDSAYYWDVVADVLSD